MTGPELRTAIERMGISQCAFARMLGVSDRQVRRWIAGGKPVPDYAVEAVNAKDPPPR